MKEIDYGTLVAKAKENDEQAISQLYNVTYKQAYFISLQIIKDEHEAQDILQECYIKAFQKLDMLKKPESFPSWINRIVSNRSIDIYRKKKPLNFSQLTSEEEEGKIIDFEDEKETSKPEVVADKKETARLLGEIVDSLSDEQRIVVMMFYFQDMSVKEIAKDLQVSENTIKSRLNYGRKKIETEVLALEKKGTKLYGLAPIPFLLLLMETNAEAATISTLVINNVLAGISSTVGSVGAGASGAGAAAGATTAASSGAKVVGGTIAKKIAIGVLIAGVTATGGTFAYKQINKDKPRIKQEDALNEKSGKNDKEDKQGNDLSEYKLDDYINIVKGEPGRPDTIEINIDSKEVDEINKELNEKINKYYDESGGEVDSNGKSPGEIDAWLNEENTIGSGVMGVTGYVGFSNSLAFHVDTNEYYDDIVTIVIDFISIDEEEYEITNGENLVYNIDINTGRILYLKDILKREGKTLNDVYNSGVYKGYNYNTIINRHMFYGNEENEADDMAYKFTGEEMFLLSKSLNFGNELLDITIIPSIDKNKITTASGEIISIQFNYLDISRNIKEFSNEDISVGIKTDIIGSRYSGEIIVSGKGYKWEGDSFIELDEEDYSPEDIDFPGFQKESKITGEIIDSTGEVVGSIKLLQYIDFEDDTDALTDHMVKDKLRATVMLNSGETFENIELRLNK